MMPTTVPAGPDVGLRVMEGVGVTVKVALSVAAPLVALTVAWPISADAGTAKVALKLPEELAMTGDGLVATDVPLKVIATVPPTG